MAAEIERGKKNIEEGGLTGFCSDSPACFGWSQARQLDNG